MISVCILTKNSAKSLRETLTSTRSFPEVLLLDNGSTDETLAIAATFPNVKVHHSPFLGFGRLRNRAAALATFDWIFALDSDEVLSPPLLQELSSLPLSDPTCVYRFLRHNFYNGKRIRGCGWGNDWVDRLYHRRHFAYKEVEVHESLETTGAQVHRCHSPLLHTPYRTTADFLAKMQHYSTLFAEGRKGTSSSLLRAIGKGAFHFCKSYFLQGGIFDGGEGFIISLYNGNTAFYKYLKLREKRGGI